MNRVEFKTVAVANHGEAMGAETISKNGHSPENLMGRGHCLKFVAALFAAGIVLFGCGKDDDDGGSDNGVVKLLEIITYSDGDFDKYEYDAQNRITKISWYDKKGAAKPRDTRTFTYNGDDLVKVERSEEDGQYESTYEFAKNGNKVTITWKDKNQPNDASISTVDLNSNGYPAKYSSSEDYYWREDIYEYQGSNLTKISYSSEETYGGETHTYSGESYYKYDNKNSPSISCKTPKWYLIWYWEEDFGSQNNVTEVTWKNDSDKKTLTYVYDDDGYPTKCTIKYSDDDKLYTREYTYITK